MHIDLDLKLALNGSATANENQLRRTLMNLTQLLGPATSANVNLALSLQTPSTLVPTVDTPTRILSQTEILTLTVAEPVPPVDMAEPTQTMAEPSKPTEKGPVRLPFAEFDPLVRAEMKRLSRGGVMPGPQYWDKARDPQLPTMGAVLRRYGCSKLADLAKRLGYLAPGASRRTADA